MQDHKNNRKGGWNTTFQEQKVESFIIKPYIKIKQRKKEGKGIKKI